MTFYTAVLMPSANIRGSVFQNTESPKPDVMHLAVHSLTKLDIFWQLLSVTLLMLGIELFIIFWVVFNNSKSEAFPMNHKAKWKTDCMTVHCSLRWLIKWSEDCKSLWLGKEQSVCFTIIFVQSVLAFPVNFCNTMKWTYVQLSELMAQFHSICAK